MCLPDSYLHTYLLNNKLIFIIYNTSTENEYLVPLVICFY